MSRKGFAPLPDDAQRIRVRTSPASLAVEASAGTGKTYLLVIRALWLILVKRIEPESLVALAFGEQAATELKQRLRAKLDEIVTAPAKDALDREISAMLPTEPLNAIQERAQDAIDALDRAHLSTIHAFASTLLRLYPAESRVDPGFEVLEDAGFDEVIRDEWSRFVAEELGERAERKPEWLAMLTKVKLVDLFDLAKALADDDTDLAALPTKPTLSNATQEWLLDTARKAEVVHGELRESLKKPRSVLVGLAQALRDAAMDGGQAALTKHKEQIAAAADLPKPDFEDGTTKGTLRAWLAASAAAKSLRSVPDESLIFAAVNLLLPFAKKARERLRLDGKLTYSGLLAQARDLLRDHPGIRKQLKKRFRAVLLDEAQDVDPMQLELILFLAEVPGETATRWNDVKLEPGKLFVVGDKKQSIYLFRGADVRAFEATVGMMETQGAETLTPTTSMRSATEVLDSVNAVGRQIFTAYPELAQRPGREPEKTGTEAEILTVEPGEGEEPEAVEAEAVSRRIEQLIESGLDPAQIAVLFRKRTPMPDFSAALRARGIEVTIEQERRFFLRQEVMDLINVARLIADPGDQVARIGVLRGPYVGTKDDALAAAMREIDLTMLFSGEFMSLRSGMYANSAHEWVERLYQVLGVEATAAASEDGSSRDAVRAFRRLLADSLETHGIPRTMELLDECVRIEGNPMAAEKPPLTPTPKPATTATGAVRFLTVHNAKGLEFPAVILADIDARPQQNRSTDTGILRDWAGGTHGITLRAIGAKEAAATLDGCRLKAMQDQEERLETARLVYVALTRARDRLIIVDRRPKNGKRPSQMADTFRPHLAALIEYPNSPAKRSTSKVTKARKHEMHESEATQPELDVPTVRPILESEAELVSPTELDERIRREEDTGEYLPAGTRNAKQWLGTLCHEILRVWDFKTEDADIPKLLPDAVEKAQARIGGPRALPDGLRQQALVLLTGFLISGTGRMLRASTVLGREVPLLSIVGGRTMSARADIVMSGSGGLRAGDFKLSAASAPSTSVGRSYEAALSASLGEPCRYEVLALDTGENG